MTGDVSKCLNVTKSRIYLWSDAEYKPARKEIVEIAEKSQEQRHPVKYIDYRCHLNDFAPRRTSKLGMGRYRLCSYDDLYLPETNAVET